MNSYYYKLNSTNMDKKKFIIFKDNQAPQSIEKVKGLNQNRISISNKNSNETGKIIPFIKEWKSERLEIRKNKKTLVETFNKNILKQIAHINFSNMTTIWVNEDHISSIEGLSRMWMPVLRILSLRTGQNNKDHNRITSVKDFKKISLPYLDTIALNHNYICQERDSFSKMGIYSDLSYLTVDFDEKDQFSMNNIRWICQMEIIKLDLLYINNLERIKEQKVEKAIKRKYLSINMNVK